MNAVAFPNASFYGPGAAPRVLRQGAVALCG